MADKEKIGFKKEEEKSSKTVKIENVIFGNLEFGLLVIRSSFVLPIVLLLVIRTVRLII